MWHVPLSRLSTPRLLLIHHPELTAWPHVHPSQASITAELEQDKTFLQGCDSEGHPLLLVIVKRHTAIGDGESCKRLIVFALDAAVRLGDTKPGWDGKSIGMLDLRSE